VIVTELLSHCTRNYTIHGMMNDLTKDHHITSHRKNGSGPQEPLYLRNSTKIRLYNTQDSYIIQILTGAEVNTEKLCPEVV